MATQDDIQRLAEFRSALDFFRQINSGGENDDIIEQLESQYSELKKRVEGGEA